jgi:hypothetical protein
MAAPSIFNYLAPGVPHFANLPLASRQRLVAAAGALRVTTVFLTARAAGDIATACATGAGHLMKWPLVSLHWTGLVAAAPATVARVAAIDVVDSASIRAPANIVLIISSLPCLRPFLPRN